jgi:antitoxin FitA
VAALTIRNLDEETKRALRVRAALHGVSMEQEARLILKSAVLPKRPEPGHGGDLPGKRFYDSVRSLVEQEGGFDLEIPQRNKEMRDPPAFE